MKKFYLLLFFFIIITTIILSANDQNDEDYFAKKYLGFNLGIKKDVILEILSSKSIKYKKIGIDSILINEHFVEDKKIDFTLLNFKGDKFVDVLLIIKIDELLLSFKNIINELEENNYKTINPIRNIYTDNPLTRIEISQEKINKSAYWLCLHYYYGEFEVKKEKSLEIVKFDHFKNLLEMSFNFGLYYFPQSFERNYIENNTNIYETPFHYNIDVGGVFNYSFFYYANKFYAPGFSVKFNCGLFYPLRTLNSFFDYIPYWFDAPVYMNIGTDIKFISKFGKIYTHYKLLLELGIFIGGRIFLTHNESAIFYTGTNINFSSHFLYGPNLFLGFEHSDKNYNFVFGGVVQTCFGNSDLNIGSDLWGNSDTIKDVNIQFIQLGFEWRWGFMLRRSIYKNLYRKLNKN